MNQSTGQTGSREIGLAVRDDDHVGEVRNIEIHKIVVQLDRRGYRFIAQTILKREGLADTPIVLRERGETPTSKVEVWIAELLRGVEREAKKEIGKIVAGGEAGENEAAARIGIGIRVQLYAANFGAKRHRVFDVRPREGVGKAQGLIADQRRNRIVQPRKIREADQGNAEVNRRHRHAGDSQISGDVRAE